MQNREEMAIERQKYQELQEKQKKLEEEMRYVTNFDSFYMSSFDLTKVNQNRAERAANAARKLKAAQAREWDYNKVESGWR